MAPESVEYELFRADEDTRILARGYYGGIWGAIAFSLFASLVTTVAYLGHTSGQFLLTVMGVTMAFTMLVGFYYILFGGVSLVMGVLFSRLIGHAIDLRKVAVLSACCTVYVPAGMLIWGTPIGGAASLWDAVLIGLGFSIPESFVAVGAWLAADREFQQEEIKANGCRQFDLKILFSVTVLLAAIMFVGQLMKIQSGFYIGFFVALIATSVFVVLVVWLRAKIRKPQHRRDGIGSA